MRILFLNQYFPPDPAPTGVLFREVADEFVRLGHEVDFVDAGQAYREGQGKGGRMKRELKALWRMLREGGARPKADVVISGSSPPCLAVAADRIACKHGAAHVHWAMDLYPELATALGEVGTRSAVGLIARLAMGRAYRRAAKVISLDADMADRLRRYGVKSLCLRPWVPRALIEASPENRAVAEPWTWAYSGNLGRAHEWETLLHAQALLEARGVDARLLFQGGGPSWASARAFALELGLRRCEWREYVPEKELPSSLFRCHALVVTQRPEVQGLLWPSKLALAMTLPRPLVFVGPTDGAIGSELRRMSHAGVFAKGDVEGVARWITERRSNISPIEAGALPNARVNRDESLSVWRSILLAFEAKG